MQLHEFFKRYGTSTTTNIQLLEYGKELGIPDLHYVMRDELLMLPKTSKNIIMNFHTSLQDGIHHVAIFNTKKHKYYFDSFGGAVPEEVVKFLSASGLGLTSDFQIQDSNTHMCGQLCLWVLYNLNRNPDKYIDIIINLNEYKRSPKRNNRRYNF